MVTGVVPSSPRFLPSIFIAHRVQQSLCSSIFNRVLLTHALELSTNQFVHEKSPNDLIRVCTRRGSNSRTNLYQARFFFHPLADGEKYSLCSPHFHVFSYTSCVDLTQMPLQSSASWRVHVVSYTYVSSVLLNVEQIQPTTATATTKKLPPQQMNNQDELRTAVVVALSSLILHGQLLHLAAQQCVSHPLSHGPPMEMMG